MRVAEKFIRSLVEKYGKENVYTDSCIWYPQACDVLRLTLSTFNISEAFDEKSQPVFKDRTESFDITIHLCKKMSIHYFMYIIETIFFHV